MASQKMDKNSSETVFGIMEITLHKDKPSAMMKEVIFILSHMVNKNPDS